MPEVTMTRGADLSLLGADLGLLPIPEFDEVYFEAYPQDDEDYDEAPVAENRCDDPLCCPVVEPAAEPTEPTFSGLRTFLDASGTRRILSDEIALTQVREAQSRAARLIRTRPIIRDDLWRFDPEPFNAEPEEVPIPEVATDLEVLHYTPTDPGYGTNLRASFQFFRRNAQNRYSSNSLMRLANAAGEFDDRTRQGTEESPRTSVLLPVLTVASRPTSFDEDTEIKSGGIVGMMVTWPDGKSLFAVIANARRTGIGRRIFNHNGNWTNYTPHFWVGTNNVAAQQFLLAMGLAPTALNGNGAVRYGYSGGEE